MQFVQEEIEYDEGKISWSSCLADFEDSDIDEFEMYEVENESNSNSRSLSQRSFVDRSVVHGNKEYISKGVIPKEAEKRMTSLESNGGL